MHVALSSRSMHGGVTVGLLGGRQQGRLRPHWMDAELPRVPNRLLNAVVFIYATVEDAYAGRSAGGTGFLVSVPFETDNKYAHLYLVTNSHVVKRSPSLAIRFNTPSGTTEIFEVSRDQWCHHPNGDDVAAIPLDLDSATYELSDVPVEIFMTETQRTNGDFGTGDECFVIGRNIGLEGERTNTPAARFGAVSIMSPEPIYQPRRKHAQDSIVVEAKSLGGYSGAPTFVYQAPPILEPIRGGMERWPVVVHSYSQSGFAMLGITWGHMNGRIAVVGPGSDLSESEKAVAVNSGMMLVVPAWKIRQLLDLESLADRRETQEREHHEKVGRTRAGIDSES